MENNENFSIGIRREIYHQKLRDLRKSKGLTQKQLATNCNINGQRYQAIEQLKSFPKEVEAYALADFFDVDAIELFPKWSLPIYKGARPKDAVFKIKKIALNSPEILRLKALNDSEVKIDNELLKENLKNILKTLRPKEKTILELRFGLNNQKSQTLEEIGSRFGVTGERIRQLEARALRKLKYSTRKKLLKTFL